MTDINNTIVLPATNAQALLKWKDVGLPKSEAGIQGFILGMDVE